MKGGIILIICAIIVAAGYIGWKIKLIDNVWIALGLVLFGLVLGIFGGILVIIQAGEKRNKNDDDRIR